MPTPGPTGAADNSRRRHTKSRLGCGECKARRIKCDETHPVCKRCSIGGRQCPFSLLAPSLPLPATVGTLSSVSPAASVESRHTQNSTIAEMAPLVPSANADQARLLHNFMTRRPDLFSFADQPTEPRFSTGTVVRESLDCPYLLNQVLAISARHLATYDLEQQDTYILQAQSYQTHALRLFTQSSIQVDEDNHLQVLFFSSLLGIQKLCDIGLDENRANAFDHFLRFLDIYRGVRIVGMQAWQFMIRGKFKDEFHADQARNEILGSGVETQLLHELISESLGLDEMQKQHCSEACARLQTVYDVARAASPDEVRSQIALHVFSWPLMVGEGFLSAARSRRPEA
ncbi:hypothetical protein B0T11DRAFT_338668, partial [Plectosphaerella cucumerina]